MSLRLAKDNRKCHPEPKTNDLATELLRGVYTERSKCAQNDKKQRAQNVSVGVFIDAKNLEELTD
ncbi:hypothetical protein BPIT_26520 [Candidatus Brocadia pituitae]|nr:hypothetical protein BPIT_26520 [Candidatus Brocadia pituitae]